MASAINSSPSSLFTLLSQARNRIGGRAESYAGGGHSSVDLGCSWIHGFAEGAPTRDLIKSLEIVRLHGVLSLSFFLSLGLNSLENDLIRYLVRPFFRQPMFPNLPTR